MRKRIYCCILSIPLILNAGINVSAESLQESDSVAEDAYVVISEESNVMLSQELPETDELAGITGKVASIALTQQEVEELRNTPGVLAVEKETVLKGMSEVDFSIDTAEESEYINDEEYLEDYNTIDNLDQWNLRAINLIKNEASSEAPVKIEILDSGISYTDDIDVIEHVNLIPGEEDVSILYEDSTGHGTGIGGMIAAKDNGEGISGINPNVELYSVKALDENLESPLSRIVEGIYWGIENEMDIINMSFGTPVYSEVLRQAIVDAYDAGILLVAAAGNTPGAAVQYPAAFPEVVAVGSTNAEGQLADHTSFGAELELLAPGEQIVTTGLFYGVLETEGTSIAAAQVTGVASLLMERDREKSPEFIRQLLRKSAKNILIDEENTAGLIDHGYALDIYNEFEESYLITEEIPVEDNQNPIEDYSTAAEEVIVGLWSNSHDKDGHYNSTVWAANSVGGFSSRNILLMSTAATNIDKFSKEFGEYVEAFHGRGNYIMNLSFLWEVANELGKNDNKVAAINTVYNRVVSRCNPTGRDAQILLQLKNSIDPYILQWNMVSGGESDKESRKFKVLGGAMHMIGDICAHRAMVPEDGAGNFNQADILSSTKAAPADSELKLWLKNGIQAEYNKKLKEHANWALFKKAIKTGCMEFRDIGKFVKDGGKNYADDATFYNVRFTITKNASTRLLKASTLADSRRIMIPRSHFIKFNNLKGYFIAAGGSESSFDYWSKISTNGFV